MTEQEHTAFKALESRLERERAHAECPCVRALLVILAKGLAGITQTGTKTRPDA